MPRKHAKGPNVRLLRHAVVGDAFWCKQPGRHAFCARGVSVHVRAGRSSLNPPSLSLSQTLSAFLSLSPPLFVFLLSLCLPRSLSCVHTNNARRCILVTSAPNRNGSSVALDGEGDAGACTSSSASFVCEFAASSRMPPWIESIYSAPDSFTESPDTSSRSKALRTCVFILVSAPERTRATERKTVFARA